MPILTDVLDFDGVVPVVEDPLEVLGQHDVVHADVSMQNSGLERNLDRWGTRISTILITQDIITYLSRCCV